MITSYVLQWGFLLFDALELKWACWGKIQRKVTMEWWRLAGNMVATRLACWEYGGHLRHFTTSSKRVDKTWENDNMSFWLRWLPPMPRGSTSSRLRSATTITSTTSRRMRRPRPGPPGGMALPRQPGVLVLLFRWSNTWIRRDKAGLGPSSVKAYVYPIFGIILVGLMLFCYYCTSSPAHLTTLSQYPTWVPRVIQWQMGGIEAKGYDAVCGISCVIYTRSSVIIYKYRWGICDLMWYHFPVCPLWMSFTIIYCT